jgi:hypothetical protein
MRNENEIKINESKYNYYHKKKYLFFKGINNQTKASNDNKHRM